jgi:uncharacterized membrane protein YfcA
MQDPKLHVAVENDKPSAPVCFKLRCIFRVAASTKEPLPMGSTFLAIGLTAGVLSGLFGIGGGILIIPSLIFFAKFHTKLAIGTSLGAMLLPVGLLGAYAYYQDGNLNIKASLLIGLGLFLGAFVGAKLAQSLSGTTLQRMFAVFIVLMAIRLWIVAGRG